MSYDIIKGISIKDSMVYITCASSNVFPRTYENFLCISLTKLLFDEGRKALDIAILREYENGNFQPGTPNRYSKAIKRLRTLPEYKEFDWREEGGNIKNRVEQKEEFGELMYKVLNTRVPKQYCIVERDTVVGSQYIKRVYKRKIAITYNKEEAKIFDTKEDAQKAIDRISDGYKTCRIIPTLKGVRI